MHSRPKWHYSPAKLENTSPGISFKVSPSNTFSLWPCNTYPVCSCSCAAWSPAVTPFAEVLHSHMLQPSPEWLSGWSIGWAAPFARRPASASPICIAPPPTTRAAAETSGPLTPGGAQEMENGTSYRNWAAEGHNLAADLQEVQGEKSGICSTLVIS